MSYLFVHSESFPHAKGGRDSHGGFFVPSLTVSRKVTTRAFSADRVRPVLFWIFVLLGPIHQIRGYVNE